MSCANDKSLPGKTKSKIVPNAVSVRANTMVNGASPCVLFSSLSSRKNATYTIGKK